MKTYASGKALLVIACNGTDYRDAPSFDIHTFFQSMNLHSKGDLRCATESVQELFWCMSMCYMHWLPLNTDKMKAGDVWRVYVQFEAASSTDYWGEYDEELTINKCKVLRKQHHKESYVNKKVQAAITQHH